MSTLKGQLLIFFIIYINESLSVIEAPYDAAAQIQKFYATLDESNLRCLVNPRTIRDFFSNDPELNKKIRDQMYEIHVISREIENSINSEMKNNLAKIVRSTIFAHKCVDSMEIFISSIADDYETFYQIMIQNGHIYDRSLHNLTTSIFPNIESNIGMIRKIMTNPKEMLPGQSGLIAAINGYAKTRYDEICNIYGSIDDILVYVFKIVVIAEIRTSVMLPFANLCQCQRKREWKTMNTAALAQFQRYFRYYGSIMKQHLELATGLYMRACDPIDGAWIIDKNYYELNEMTQTIIFRYQSTVCPSESCQDMWQQETSRCDARYYDERSGCSTKPTNCKNLGAVQACVLRNGPRKLHYINSTILGFSGNNSKCPEDGSYIINNGKGSDSAYATCGCQCHENHNKISLVIMEIRVYRNEVIIGLRFKRSKDILHIQPRVGKLMANGYIQKYSERWLGIPNDIDASQIHSANKDTGLFFLDDVLLPPKFVLTGVGFAEVKRGAVTGLTIKIFGVPFDYRSGQLDLGGRIELSSSRDKLGQPLSLFPLSSLQTEEHNTPSSTDMKYVHLQQSLSRSDFRQSVLALFDAIPVTTDPSAALRGIGIFRKSVKNYAAFISLRTYGISYAPYFENFTSTYTMEG